MSDADLALDALPGVRRHVRGVRDALRAGRSCLWLVPHAVSAPERFARLVDLLGREAHLVEAERPPIAPTPAPVTPLGGSAVRPATAAGSVEEMLRGVFRPPDGPAPARPTEGECPEPLAERVLRAAQRFGCALAEPDEAPSVDPLVHLASLCVPDGVTVTVRADDEPDLDEVVALVRRYPTLSQNRSGRMRNRPTVLVAGSHERLADAARPDPLTVHWWWEVYTRLDLLTVATTESDPDRASPQRRMLDELCPDLVPETIAEVAGPDVDLAAHLAREWDGTQAHLARELKAHAAAGAAPSSPVLDAPAGTRPPRRWWDDWVSGRVDAWDRRLRATPDSDAQLAERVWIGQSRALQPVLDGLRRSLVDEVMRQSAADTLAELDRTYNHGAGLASIELTALRLAVREGALQLPKRRQELLDHLVGARNELAHRKYVADARLGHLHRLTAGLADPGR